MSRNLERFGRLATSGPRNTSSRRPDQFVLEDLLIALGWIGKRHVSDGMLSKYTGTGEMPTTLIDAVRSRWKVPSRRYKLTDVEFEALVRLAITEHFDARTCHHCHGTGTTYRWHKRKYKPFSCPDCWGSGRKPFSVRAKARALGVHKNTWGLRDLEALYQRMLDSLSTWETHGRRKVDFYLMRERDLEHRRIE